jgi:hypothetical protein
VTAERAVALLSTLAACLAVWALRAELRALGGLAWDLRYLLLGAAAALLLGLAERAAARFAGGG